MTCINETKQNKTKKKLYNYCHLYQSILVSVMPFGYNLRGSIQIVKNLFFIRIPCSLSFLFGFLVHSTGSMCIYLLSNLSQPSRIYIHQIDFYNNFVFFALFKSLSVSPMPLGYIKWIQNHIFGLRNNILWLVITTDENDLHTKI